MMFYRKQNNRLHPSLILALGLAIAVGGVLLFAYLRPADGQLAQTQKPPDLSTAPVSVPVRQSSKTALVHQSQESIGHGNASKQDSRAQANPTERSLPQQTLSKLSEYYFATTRDHEEAKKRITDAATGNPDLREVTFAKTERLLQPLRVTRMAELLKDPEWGDIVSEVLEQPGMFADLREFLQQSASSLAMDVNFVAADTPDSFKSLVLESEEAFKRKHEGLEELLELDENLVNHVGAAADNFVDAVILRYYMRSHGYHWDAVRNAFANH